MIDRDALGRVVCASGDVSEVRMARDTGDAWGRPSPLEEAFRAMNGGPSGDPGREDSRMRNRTALLVAAAGLIPIAAGAALFAVAKPRGAQIVEERVSAGDRSRLQGLSDREVKTPRQGEQNQSERSGEKDAGKSGGGKSGVGKAGGPTLATDGGAAVVRRQPEAGKGGGEGRPPEAPKAAAEQAKRADAGKSGDASRVGDAPKGVGERAQVESSKGGETRVTEPSKGLGERAAVESPKGGETRVIEPSKGLGERAAIESPKGGGDGRMPVETPRGAADVPAAVGGDGIGAATSASSADRAELLERVSTLQRDLRTTQERLGALAGEMERRMSQLREQDAVLQRTLVNLQEAERAREGEAARRSDAEAQREKTTAALLGTHELYGPLTPVRIEYRRRSCQRRQVAERADIPLGPLWDGLGDIFVGTLEAFVGPQGDGQYVALFPGGGEAVVDAAVMERWRALGVEVVEVDPVPAARVMASPAGPSADDAPAGETEPSASPVDVPVSEPVSEPVEMFPVPPLEPMMEPMTEPVTPPVTEPSKPQ